ncbi:MAG: hypothetical protein ACLQFR_21400 [Streptosporangiaceae bacterium]
MGQFRRTAAGLVAAGLLAAVVGCAPAYNYAADSADNTFFRVPASWQQLNPEQLAAAQDSELATSAAGPPGGAFAWSRAYAAQWNASAGTLLTASSEPVVYASVQSLSPSLQAALSFNFMRDLLFPVTSGARQQAAKAGSALSGFALISSSEITAHDGVRGINELYEYTINGLPDAFDQTVLTNSTTTKLYLLLVQCYQTCFVAHLAQIKDVVNSFTVRGS